MVIQFPRQAFNMTNNYAKGVRLLAVLTLGVAGFSTTAAAADTAVVELRPYKAEYKTTARGLSLTLKRELTVSEDGIYTLTNGGNILVAGFLEKSVFEVDGVDIVPGSYVYQGTGLINRRREVHFTPGADSLRSLYKDKWYDLPYTEGTLDRMSQQEHLRLLLLNDPTPKEDIVITVADGKRIKDYQLIFVGEETLQTPLGPVDTFHFSRVHKSSSRSSDTWIAPAWDYMMVKTVHVENGKPVEAMLTKASIEGVPVQSK